MSLGRPIGAKLFLEGKEVPFIGCTITCSVNQASIAYVDLVPHKKINDIKPRTLVQIFVRDYRDEGPKCVFPYVLAWEGEVYGFNFGKTPASRSFSISCIDFTSYWDNVLAYYFNSQQSLGSGSTDKASQALVLADVDAVGERVINVVMSQASYFKIKIEEVIKSTEKLKEGDPKKKDFLDAIAAIYADVGYINDFFYAAEDRLRIRDRIVMHSSKVLSKLVDEKVAMSWFTDLPGKSSGYTSLRFILQDLMGILFHDSVTIPFPAEVKAGAFMSEGKEGLRSSRGGKYTIGSYVFKPNLYMLPPPACNIFFPDEYASFQFSRMFIKEPTRLIYQPEMPARFGQGAAAVYMPHVYQPPSFHEFMKKKTGDYSKYVNTGGMGVSESTKNQGHYGDDEPKSSPFYKSTTGKKREAQFLTAEESVKGIILSRESMMPASSAFRFSLDDHADQKKDFSEKVAQYLFYKKRFQDRQLQITSHLKLSVVPGFPVLILDDSDSDQNVVAYCDSVTHRIYATEGGYTNVQLSYARHMAEQDVSDTHGARMLIPPWFEEQIFGTMTTPKDDSKAAKEEVKKLGVTHIPGKKLGDFYATLLGDMGSKPVTALEPGESTLVGAVNAILAKYRTHKSKGVRDIEHYIYVTTTRRYIRMKEAMGFIASTTSEKDVDTANWIEFRGGAFSRSGKQDEAAVNLRGSVIKEYRDKLKEQRGFRG
jgi:hypothetical protein